MEPFENPSQADAERELLLARALAADPANEEAATAKLKGVLRVARDVRTRRTASLELARVLEGPPNVVRSGIQYAAAIAILRASLAEQPRGDAEIERVIARLERKRSGDIAAAAERLAIEEALLNTRDA